MSCKHKFYNDLQLTRLDFEPETLIIGTFNPEWPGSNTAEWFYGRTADSCFWDILPRLYGQPSLIQSAPAAWKEFCRSNKIALTDLISELEDANPAKAAHSRILGGFADKALIYNFEDFAYVSVVKLLQSHPSIRNVYITRGITEAFWRHLWNPIAHYCSVHQLHAKVLLTPSPDADYHHAAHNAQHPGEQIPRLEDYILMRWKAEWHF